MTKDEIISMAREAGAGIGTSGRWLVTQDELERFATLIATAERHKLQSNIERCKAEHQPLTDEQIKAAVRHLYGSDAVAAMAVTGDIETARAVEAAHGIK